MDQMAQHARSMGVKVVNGSKWKSRPSMEIKTVNGSKDRHRESRPSMEVKAVTGMDIDNEIFEADNLPYRLSIPCCKF